MKYLIVLLIGLVLTGCATEKVVNLPIPVKAKTIEVEPPPQLPIYQVNKGSPSPKIIDALRRSLQIELLYADYLSKVHHQN